MAFSPPRARRLVSRSSATMPLGSGAEGGGGGGEGMGGLDGVSKRRRDEDDSYDSSHREMQKQRDDLETIYERTLGVLMSSASRYYTQMSAAKSAGGAEAAMYAAAAAGPLALSLDSGRSAMAVRGGGGGGGGGGLSGAALAERRMTAGGSSDELCVGCGQRGETLPCAHCGVQACAANGCLVQCEGCSEIFCTRLCSTQNYDAPTTRNFCLACNVAESRRVKENRRPLVGMGE